MIKKIKNMTVEKKLKYCFLLIVLLASVSGVVGVIALMISNLKYGDVLVENGFSQGEIGIFSTYLNKEPAMIRELILLNEESEMREAAAELEEISKRTDTAFEALKKNCNTEKEKQYIKTIEDLLPRYRNIFAKVEELAMQNRNDEALELLLTSGKPTLKQLTDAVEELVDLNVDLGNKESKIMTMMTWVILGVMAIIITGSIFTGMKVASIIAKMFAEPIIKVKDASAELAKGNLDIQIEKLYPDEIGDMTDSFKEATSMMKIYIAELSRGLAEIAKGNFDITPEVEFKGDFVALANAIEMIIQSLSATMGTIHTSSEQVSSGAYQLAGSAQALAEGATDQAASVQELTATIQNITETVVHSSGKAKESYNNAKQFQEAAEKSNDDIKELKLAMERINDTSKEIVNIITAIEDIASQTNLLSLNASIEAARAGDAGRGFAVVADQIGKLAADSAASAANTKRLIGNSIIEIEHGNEITERTTQAIESIIKGINFLANSTNEISQLTMSEADAMKQLEAGVEQISEVIQSNSAAAEETSATSEELSAQSTSLEQLVGKFTLKQ